MNIKFGIQIEPQFGFTYKTIKEVASDGEKLGYYSIWASDHFFLDEKSEDVNCFEAWTLISALAEATSTLRIGTLVTCNSYRHPTVLAKMAATVDAISNGRLEFGIGAGWKDIEYNAYGIPFPSVKIRMEQLEEAILVIKKLWTEPKASFTGKHYRLTNALSAPKPVQKPYPPIFIGGGGEQQTLKFVAKYGDYMNLPFTPIDELDKKLNALKAHCKAEGRDYDTIGKSYFSLAYTSDDPEKIAEELVARANRQKISLEKLKSRIYNSKHPGAWIGSPEELKDRIDFMISLGFDYFHLVFPYPKDQEASKDFAKLVMNKYFK